MDPTCRPLPDEVHGARAAGALLAGEFEEAVHALGPASGGYVAGFFLRLAVVSSGVAVRLACQVTCRRVVRPGPGNQS